MLKVRKECLRQNYFRFNNTFYIQGAGLSMGPSLSPIMAEMFMNDLENRLLDITKYKEKVQLWVRYVAVSYTHLDVYKRQLLYYAACVNLLNILVREGCQINCCYSQREYSHCKITYVTASSDSKV